MSPALVLRHVLNAFSAASHASATCCSDAEEEGHSGWLVLGQFTSKVVSVTTSWPLIQSGTGPAIVMTVVLVLGGGGG